MSDLQNYSGSCHCGNVKYDVDLDLSGGVISCNCSICRRTGALLAFVPPEQFNLHSGADKVSDYQFNKKIIHHLFCSNCGIRAFCRGTGPDGKKMVSVNVRCLDGVDLDKLKINHYDGAHH
ncbi:MAG: GFA family protein [Myxococcota bacterium]